jgi:hypothetical protein
MTIGSFLARSRHRGDVSAMRVRLDTVALEFVSFRVEGPIVIVAPRPGLRTPKEYQGRPASAPGTGSLPSGSELLFLEVVPARHPRTQADLPVHGFVRHGQRILQARGPAVPATIATVLLHLRDVTGLLPHVHFLPASRNRFTAILRPMRGDAASRETRNLLAAAEPDPGKRPRVHTFNNGATDAGT